jgi:hypothetical protein
MLPACRGEQLPRTLFRVSAFSSVAGSRSLTSVTHDGRRVQCVQKISEKFMSRKIGGSTILYGND